MALFVAKFLDSQRVKDVGPDRGEISPIRRTTARTKQVFTQKLARVLKKGPKVFYTQRGDDFGENLAHVLAARKPGIQHVRWPQDQMDLLASIPVVEESSDPQKFLTHAIAYLENLVEQQRIDRERERERLEAKERDLRKKAGEVLLQFPAIKKALDEIELDVRKIEGIIEPELKDLRKMEFLENLIACVKITDNLHETTKKIDDQYVSQLASVAVMCESLIGRSRDIIQHRVAILTRKIVEHFVKVLENHEIEFPDPQRVHAFKMLAKFQHSEPDKALALFLAVKMQKFRFHFTRSHSALNAIDKPEWPLRWLLDLAVETSKVLTTEDDPVQVAKYIAKYVRRYFLEYRWGLVSDPQSAEEADLFSLYLARYLHSVQQWTDTFGESAAQELLVVFRENISVGVRKWGLLDAWIDHDRTHIEKAIQATKNPFKPSAFNPAICNLFQTLQDIFDTSRARLGPIERIPGLLEYFIENCHEQVLEDLVYRLRVTITDDFNGEDSALLNHSIGRFVEFMDGNKLASLSVRRQLGDLVKLI